MSARIQGAERGISLPFPAQKTEEATDEMPPARDRSSVPNFVFAIVVTLILAIMAFVAQNFYWKGQVDKDNEHFQGQMKEMKDEIKSLQTYNQNLREKMAAQGYLIDEAGNVTKVKRGG